MRCYALVVLVGSLALPGLAEAADSPVSLGSGMQGLDGDTARSRCGDDPYPVPCAGVQQAIPGRLTQAPYDGVIVRWRVRGAGTFAVFPATYGADDTIIRFPGSSVERVASADVVAEFPTRLPILAGQHVGIWLGDHSALAWREATGADWDVWRPDPPIGAASLASTLRDGAFEAGFSVDVEPDMDRDGFGEPTQDLCGSDASTQGPCRPVPAPVPVPVPLPGRTLLEHDLEAAASLLHDTGSRRVLRHRGLKLRVTSATAGSFRFSATTTGSRRRTVLRGRRIVSRAGAHVLSAKLTRSGRSLLRHRRRLTLRLRLAFVDPSGHRTTATGRATLTRVGSGH
jgi:hypothetical protein